MDNNIIKRIIILRHGEQATKLNKNIKKEDSEIGLTNQGVIRAYYTPYLIDKLLHDIYEVHSYTHDKGIGPVCRSYYTALPLMSHEKSEQFILYKRSSDIDKLIENIKNSKSKNIVIIWEHLQIPLILQGLLNLEKDKVPNYKEICKNIKKSLKNSKCQDCKDTLSIKETIKIKPKINKKIKNITRCNYHFQQDNNKVCDEFIKNDIPYSLVWDVKLYNDNLQDSYNVYLGLLINNKSNVTFYI